MSNELRRKGHFQLELSGKLDWVTAVMSNSNQTKQDYSLDIRSLITFIKNSPSPPETVYQHIELKTYFLY